MYERFTEQARKVITLANQQAVRLNHAYVGLEHLLLGLVEDNIGVAAAFILRKSRAAIATEVQRLVSVGPEMITMGKLPFTPAAKRVIEYSMEEARSLKHSKVTTGHLLLGILRENAIILSKLLQNEGLEIKSVRETISRLSDSELETLDSIPAVYVLQSTTALDGFCFGLCIDLGLPMDQLSRIATLISSSEHNERYRKFVELLVNDL